MWHTLWKCHTRVQRCGLCQSLVESIVCEERRYLHYALEKRLLLIHHWGGRPTAHDGRRHAGSQVCRRWASCARNRGWVKDRVRSKQERRSTTGHCASYETYAAITRCEECGVMITGLSKSGGHLGMKYAICVSQGPMSCIIKATVLRQIRQDETDIIRISASKRRWQGRLGNRGAILSNARWLSLSLVARPRARAGADPEHLPSSEYTVTTRSSVTSGSSRRSLAVLRRSSTSSRRHHTF